MYHVLTFYSTYQAIKFESIYKNSQINITLMPVPREISSSCGIAAKITDLHKEEELKEVVQNSSKQGVEIEGLYFMQQKNKKNHVQKLSGKFPLEKTR